MESITQLRKRHQVLGQKELFPIPANKAEELILRTAIKKYSEELWSIPYPLQYKYFQEYYLLYWKGSHLIKQVKEGYLYNHDGFGYKIVYKPGLTRGKILANLDAQYPLSFRNPSTEWNLLPIVIVGEAKS